jgi:flagellar hook protein FlgE
MGLYGALQASVSGMAAQSNKLSAISQNIANSNTNGYKNVEAQFEDLVSSADQNSFNGAGVTTNYSYLNSVQGSFTTTSTSTNMAINGSGFFYVQNSAGEQFLTRDGDFTPDSSGNLVNDAGYTLLGTLPGTPPPANNTAGLIPVNVNSKGSNSDPTTSGTLSVNLPATATTVAAADLPSANAAAAVYTEKTSLVTYNELNAPVTLDVYMTKSGANSWDLAVFNQADAASGGGFPYTSPALASETLNFSASTGDLTSSTTTPVSITLPGSSGQTLNLDISGMTQLGSTYSISTASMNGSSGGSVTGVSISPDGSVSATYSDGTQTALANIYLADVPNPDGLTPITGNVFQANAQSGNPVAVRPGQGVGAIESSTLESSTVDLATELTNMISAQSGYEANSKVFQTGSSLLEELVNLIK